MSEEEQAINESAEEIADPDSPTGEETQTETTPEPAAEGETGDTQESQAGAEAEGDTYGPVPYDRFSEVNQERKRYKEQAEFYQQLLSNPAIAAALQGSQGEGTTGPTEGQEGFLPDKEDYEFDSDIQRDSYRAQQRIERQFHAYMERAQSEYQKQARSTFFATVDELSSADKFVLSEEDRQKLEGQGYILQRGLEGAKQPVDFATIARQAYQILKPELQATAEKRKAGLQNQRDAAVRQQKQRTSAGQVGDMGGPGSGSTPQYDDDDEAFEANYRAAYGE